MVKIIERYTCEKCGTEYGARAFAEICESGAIPEKPGLIGKRVRFEVDHSDYDDVVTEVFVGPGIVSVTCAETNPDAERVSYVRGLRENRHEWRARVRGEYDFDGVPIHWFRIDDLKVIGRGKAK